MVKTLRLDHWRVLDIEGPAMPFGSEFCEDHRCAMEFNAFVMSSVPFGRRAIESRTYFITGYNWLGCKSSVPFGG